MVPKLTSNYVVNKKKSNQIKTKIFNWTYKARIHLNYYKCYIHIPFLWDMLFIRTQSVYKIYIYSSTYFINVPLPSTFTNCHYDLNTRTVSFNNLAENNYKNLYLNQLSQLLSLSNNPCFVKIKFKGKGYYIYKNKRSTITPQFGFAHRHYIYAFYVSVKFRSKTSIMLYGLSPKDLTLVGLQIKSLRPINIFTGRGVRFNKQSVYKKTGKVSSYR